MDMMTLPYVDPERMTVTVSEDRSPLIARANPLTTVLDPTVTRVAEIFANGMSRAGDNPNRTWTLIKDNLADFAAFVDALVLEPGLAVPDYGLSMLGGGNLQRRLELVSGPLFGLCHEVLAPVTVAAAVWWPIRELLFQQLKDATPLPQIVTSQLAARLDRMQWVFGEELLKEEPYWVLSNNMLVNGFLYVSLLFGRYASQMNGTQLLSPAATSALLTAELSTVGALDTLSDVDLFKKLQDVYDNVAGAEKRTLRVSRPSFLPYLLSLDGVQAPADLFSAAIAQRGEPEVRAYRAWLLAEVRAPIATGNMPLEAQRDVEQIVEDIRRKYATRGPLSVEVQATVGLWPPTFAVTTSGRLDLTRMRDWVLQAQPSKRYQRMLLNLTLATAEGVQPDLRLRQLWDAA